MDVMTERLDHLGVIAGVIKEIGLIELVDKMIPKHPKEEISTGEAVAGMVINGLGFSDRPMTLTPQFYETKAMKDLFREGVKPEMFNRFKLGRALDACYEHGCEMLFSEISLQACERNGIDCRFNSEDTTSFSLTGEYDVETDEQAIELTYGYSKDHRPDLKQVVLELLVSQDGGVPIDCKSWSGNTSDSKIFKKRAKELVDAFKNGNTPRYLIADSKLYTKECIKESLGQIPFITRVPGTVKLERESINEALEAPVEQWEKLDERNKCLSMQVNYGDLQQRWIIVGSKEMENRAKKAAQTARKKEHERLSRGLKKMAKQRFSCKSDAQRGHESLGRLAKFHEIEVEHVVEHKVYAKKGRPGPDAEFTTVYQAEYKIVEDQDAVEARAQQGSCYVLATTVPEKELSDREVVAAYKGQNSSVERGFRFLKDPIFFTSSLYVKSPKRVMGLLMVMTLALLVYSIAQRNMRRYLEEYGKTLPNQIKKEIVNPTLRWIFQIMEGITIVRVSVEGKLTSTFSGITDLHLRILECFPPSVQQIYGLAA